MEFAHARKGVESSEEVVSNVHCAHTGQPWENGQLHSLTFHHPRSPVDTISYRHSDRVPDMMGLEG